MNSKIPTLPLPKKPGQWKARKEGNLFMEGLSCFVGWNVRDTLTMTVPLDKQIRKAGLQPTWSSKVKLWNSGAAKFINLVVDWDVLY